MTRKVHCSRTSSRGPTYTFSQQRPRGDRISVYSQGAFPSQTRGPNPGLCGRQGFFSKLNLRIHTRMQYRLAAVMMASNGRPSCRDALMYTQARPPCQNKCQWWARRHSRFVFLIHGWISYLWVFCAALGEPMPSR